MGCLPGARTRYRRSHDLHVAQVQGCLRERDFETQIHWEISISPSSDPQAFGNTECYQFH